MVPFLWIELHWTLFRLYQLSLMLVHQLLRANGRLLLFLVICILNTLNDERSLAGPFKSA